MTAPATARHRPNLRHSCRGVRQPFTSPINGVTLDRERTGQRTWDLNTDGVANYGLVPDWIADMRGPPQHNLAERLTTEVRDGLKAVQDLSAVPARMVSPSTFE